MPDTIIQSNLNKARDDKFLLVFDVPPALKEKNATFDRRTSKIFTNSVQFSIYGTAVPEIVVPAIDVKMQGSHLYISSHGKNAYPPVQIKFNIDNEYNNYWVLYSWLDLLHDEYLGIFNEENIETDPKRVSRDFQNYTTDLTVYGLDENNQKKIKFTYKNAFPTAIEPIEYDYQKGEEIVSGFRFVYSQIHTELVN